MSVDSPLLTKAQRREAARAEAARLRAQQQRKAKRARVIALGALGAAVVALVVVATLVLREGAATRAGYQDVAYGGGEQNVQAPELADVAAPSVSDAAGGIPVSAQGVGTTGAAPVQVAVYLDFRCPFCARFEEVNGPVLEEMVGAGEIAVTYHMVSFLDPRSAGSSYSTRAATAAAVVAQDAPDHYGDFMATLFANQPTEDTIGLTDPQIAGLAHDVGVPAHVTEQFTATVTGTYTTVDGEEQQGTWRTYAPWVAALTAQAGSDLGELRTPTVLIDGEPFAGDLTGAGSLEAALRDARP